MRGVKLYLAGACGSGSNRGVIVPVRGVKLYEKDPDCLHFSLSVIVPVRGVKLYRISSRESSLSNRHRPREGCKAVQQICTKNIRRNKAVPYRLSLAYHVWGTNTSTLPPKIEKRRALGGTVWCETPCSRPVSGREKRGFAHGPKGHCHDKKECTNREKHDIIKISS